LVDEFYKALENNGSNLNYKDPLENGFKIVKKAVKFVFYFDGFIFNSAILFLIIFLVTGKYLLPFPIYIPWIDYETLYGYLMNVFFHIFSGTNGFITFTPIDMLIVFYAHHCYTMSLVLRWKIKSFNDELMADEERLRVTNESVKKGLISLLKDYEDYCDFTNEYAKLIALPFTMALIVNVIGICMCIIQGLKINIFLGLGGSAGLQIQLAIPFAISIMQTFQVKE
jgi:hypothetical protein